MNDEQYDPTPEQKREWTFKALELSGYARIDDLDAFSKIVDGKNVIVDLTAGKSFYFKDGRNKIVTDDEAGTLAKISQVVVNAEDGIMPTKKEADIVIGKAEPAPAQPNIPHTLTTGHMPELTIEIIKRYINDKATDEEAYIFLQLCQARKLNPFLKQAYLIKYDHTAPASMVVGKDAFMERAELHGQFDGFEAGIITDTDVCRVGTYLKSGEELLGGWAKVYRKDRARPVHVTVSMAEYDTGKSSWKKMPATMIRKVALVQALREAFPSELGGLYDQSEMGVEVTA